MKMFGLTYLTEKALKQFSSLAQNYGNEKNIYFHQVIIDNITYFNNLSVKMSPNSVSFNTLMEYNEIHK